MRATDWFVVGVRLVGVWMFVSAAQEAIYLLNAELGYVKASYPIAVYGMHVGGDVLIGLALTGGARSFAGWVGGWEATRTTATCANCGYDLRATPGRCPECGTAGPSPA